MAVDAPPQHGGPTLDRDRRPDPIGESPTGYRTNPGPDTERAVPEDSVLVGRGREADLVLEDPRVSRRHARLTRVDGRIRIEDLGSANGTFVDGERLRPREPRGLSGGERLRFGDTEALFQPDGEGRGGLVLLSGASVASPAPGPQGSLHGMRLEVRGVGYGVRHRGREVPLLRDVSFTAEPGELLAIVGPSGAGKSTLVSLLNGMRRPTAGAVLYNGVPLHEHLEALRTAIGYVPQDDIIHRELSVYSVLRYSAELRLPADTTPDQLEAVIDEVLEELDLRHRRDAVVSTLSGGERKRVNIAVELLTRPGILLLDEPTSGLDPGLERRVVSLIQRLAREGRTLLFVTHASESIAACDKVLFLSRGGEVAFFGTPRDALRFFGVTELADAYLKLAEEAGDWPARYRASEYVREPSASAAPVPAPPLLRAPVRRRSAREQLGILARRYAEVLRGDPRNLLILLLQAPFIALILALLYQPDTFSTLPATEPGESPPIGNAPEMLFLMVIAALWFGTCNSAREISKERAIFLRERLVSLRIWPYLLSKAGILSLLCLLQSAMLLGIVQARVDFRVSQEVQGMLLAALFLTSLAATLQGLLVSSLARSNDQAMSLVPLVILPQVIFSGMLVGLDDLGPLRAVANLMPSRWGYGALTALTDLSGRYAKADIARNAKAVFDTSPEGALLALALLGLVSLVAAWAALVVREQQ